MFRWLAILLLLFIQHAGARDQAVSLRILLSGTEESEVGVHGMGNLYAPEIHRDGAGWKMWYGAQGRDGHDRIHLAESADLIQWEKKGVVLEESGVNHVNDPSVVRVNGEWWMFYTRAEIGIRDTIAAATSKDGKNWTLKGVVFEANEEIEWASLVVSRPSVLHEDGVFRMWFDARGLKEGEDALKSDLPEELLRVASRRAVGYAESEDGIHWNWKSREPVLEKGAGAVHVFPWNGMYGMAYESHLGTRWAISRDGGFTWKAIGSLVPLSGMDADQGGHVTPFVLQQNQQAPLKLFTGVNQGDWSRNAIGLMDVPGDLSLAIEKALEQAEAQRRRLLLQIPEDDS